MAFTSIQIKAINSDDGDSFDEILDKAKDVPHIQEIIAVGVAILLACSSDECKAKCAQEESGRRRHLQQRMASAFVMDEHDRPGRFPPN